MRLGKIVGMPSCTERTAHLQSNENMLELFEYQKPRGRKIPPDRTQGDQGLTHIGLKSTDVLTDYDRLQKLGVTFLSKPVEFRHGVWVVYFYAPDGGIWELR